MNKEELEGKRYEQLIFNCRWLIEQIDKIHTAICPNENGTWQERANQAVAASTKLMEENKELHALCGKMSDILVRTAIALKGEPKSLCGHDWSDLPEVAEKLKAKNEEILKYHYGQEDCLGCEDRDAKIEELEKDRDIWRAYQMERKEEIRRKAFLEAAEMAELDSMKDWTGGSTGNAVGTANKIIAALRRKAEG